MVALQNQFTSIDDRLARIAKALTEERIAGGSRGEKHPADVIGNAVHVQTETLP